MADVISETQVASTAPAPRRSGAWRWYADKALGVLLPLAAICAALGGWEAWVRLGNVPPYVMAPFSKVAQVAWDQHSILLHQSWITLYEALLGFGVAVGVGTVAGLLIDSSWRVEQALWPFLVASQVMPVVAFAPVIIVWFGFGLTPKVIIVALLSTFLVTIECVTGLKSLEPEKLLLCRSIGASRFQIYVKVKLPQALPSLFTGIKLAAMLALTGAVVGEFVASQNGLGYYVNYEGQVYIAAATAGILYLVVMGVGLYCAVAIAEKLAIPWHASKRTDWSGRG
jgi:NitT/TauT family transport system permease protein